MLNLQFRFQLIYWLDKMLATEDMKKITDLSKLKINEGDDNQFVDMINECNKLIDQYNALNSPDSPQGKSLRVQIVNYKNKIEKIRKGY